MSENGVDIRALAALLGIIAGTTQNNVITAKLIGIITRPAIKGIVAVSPEYDIVASSAPDIVVADTGINDIRSVAGSVDDAGKLDKAGVFGRTGISRINIRPIEIGRLVVDITHNVVIACAADYQVLSITAHQHIIAGAACQGIVAVATVEPIAFDAAVGLAIAVGNGIRIADLFIGIKPVVALSAEENIAIGSADQNIVAAAKGFDDVVATFADDAVITGTVVQDIRTTGFGLAGIGYDVTKGIIATTI